MDRKKVCVITGANSGIGKAAAEQIGGCGYHVVMACRSVERGDAAKAEILARVPEASLEVMKVDMGSRASIIDFSRRLVDMHSVVDVLIHNAAVFDIGRKEPLKTEDGFESVWAVNHLGPVLMTELLLDGIRKSGRGRIITVSSKGLVVMPRLKVDIEDPEFENRRYSVNKAYYQAKRAQVIYTWWLADRLQNSGVTANCVRVTAVRLDLSRHPEISGLQRWVYPLKSRMSLSPDEMARTYTWLATSEEAAEENGGYFDEKRRKVDSVPYTHDPLTIDAVMRLTARYVPEIAGALK